MIVISINTAARLIKIDTRFATFNEWKEENHPRDGEGKFALTGGNSGKSEKPVASLSKEEYGKIMHELNNNLTKEQRKKKIIKKAIGNHYYTVKNNGFNEYIIIEKEDIDGIYD